MIPTEKFRHEMKLLKQCLNQRLLNRLLYSSYKSNAMKDFPEKHSRITEILRGQYK